MKNQKFYMKSLALIVATSISLLSGCACSNKKEANETNETNESIEYCRHLTVYFENEGVTFKECDGYDIKLAYLGYSATCSYSIYYNDKLLLDGQTLDYNAYDVVHDCADKELDIAPIQKSMKR